MLENVKKKGHDDDDVDGTFTRVAGAGEAPEILGAMVAVYWGLVALLDKAADDDGDDDGDEEDDAIDNC